MSSHTAAVHDILRALNRIEFARFFKNSVGHGYTERGTPLQYGLSVGSSDLIGIVRGQFAAYEVKTGKGVRSKEQIAFHNTIERLGGRIAVVHSIEEALEYVHAA